MERKREIIEFELGLSLGVIRDMTDLTYEVLSGLELFTENELQLVTKLNGYNLETLNDVLFIRTGYRNIKQFIECEYNVNIYEEDYIIEVNGIYGNTEMSKEPLYIIDIFYKDGEIIEIDYTMIEGNAKIFTKYKDETINDVKEYLIKKLPFTFFEVKAIEW